VARLGISRSYPDPATVHRADRRREPHRRGVERRGGAPVGHRGAADAGGRRANALALLERFGLAAQADRPVAELAGGVRKLVDIAIALARRPKLLLLDEPTSGVSAEE